MKIILNLQGLRHTTGGQRLLYRCEISWRNSQSVTYHNYTEQKWSFLTDYSTDCEDLLPIKQIYQTVAAGRVCGKCGCLILCSSFSVIHQFFNPCAPLLEGRLCVWLVQRKVSVMEYYLVCMNSVVILERTLVPWGCFCVFWLSRQSSLSYENLKIMIKKDSFVLVFFFLI